MCAHHDDQKSFAHCVSRHRTAQTRGNAVFCISCRSASAHSIWRQACVALRCCDAVSKQAGLACLVAHAHLFSPLQITPWRAFLRNAPVRALAYTHFCNNW